MSKKSSKERKLKRKRRLEESVSRDDVKFDVFRLLAEEPLKTKPDVGQFLSKFVKEIRVLPSPQKIWVYPVFDYSVSKVMVEFADGQHLLAESGIRSFRTSLWKDLKETVVSERQRKSLDGFISTLNGYGFLGRFSNAEAFTAKEKPSDDEADEGGRE